MSSTMTRNSREFKQNKRERVGLAKQTQITQKSTTFSVNL